MKRLLIHISISACLLAPVITQLSDAHGSVRLGGNNLVEFSSSKEFAVCPHYKSKQAIS